MQAIFHKAYRNILLYKNEQVYVKY